MNRTSIEWVRNPDGSQGYTHNPMSGCRNHTPEGLCLGGLFPCYAYKLANGRLKPLYLANTNIARPNTTWFRGSHAEQRALLDPFYPRFWEERLSAPYSVMRVTNQGGVYYEQKPKGIFVCDMGELFGDWIPSHWQANIFQAITDNSQHRFYLLTKQPQNLVKFSPFPDNCWVGVTATNADMVIRAGYCLTQIQARIKFLSLEPLLEWQHGKPGFIATMFQNWGINWLIIGACTGTEAEMTELARKYTLTEMPYANKWTAQPNPDSVREIVEAADKAGIPVFLKDNLLDLVNYQSPETDFAFNKEGCYRQEMPK